MQEQRKFLVLSEEVEKAVIKSLYAQAIDIHSPYGKDQLVKNICKSVANYIKEVCHGNYTIPLNKN